MADAGFNPYVTVLITSGKTLREKPELVNKAIGGVPRKDWRAYLDEPTAANKEMGTLNHGNGCPQHLPTPLRAKAVYRDG